MVSSIDGSGSVAKLFQQQRQQVESQKIESQQEQQRATEQLEANRHAQERTRVEQSENSQNNDPTNRKGRSVDISV